jgi:hypothetical protein
MNMNGWDTVFVVAIDQINSALKNSTSKLVQTFSFSEQGFTTSGNFGVWSIAEGGSGTDLMLQIDISKGSMTMSDGGTSIDISGMSALMLVNLKLLPDKTSGQTLQFDFQYVDTSNSNTDSSPAAGMVSPHDIIDNGVLSLVQKAALENAIANVLVQNASAVSFVFATINPTVASDVQWLKAEESHYCYLAPSGSAPVLAILSVTTKRDTSNLELGVDPSLLTGSGNAGLAISSGLFLENVIGPALIKSLGTTGSLALAGTVLQNTGTLHLPKIEKSGESYEPEVKSLKVTIADTEIKVACSGSCDMHMNIKMTFKSNSTLGVSLDSKNQALQLGVVGKTTFHKSVKIPWYDHLLDAVTVVAEAVLQICVTAISSQLASGISSLTSSNHLVRDAPSLVSWAGASGFNAQEASLATSFYMRGTLT